MLFDAKEDRYKFVGIIGKEEITAMKANENKILRLLSGDDKQFIIPVYQRAYSWKKENCIQLMKDLKDVCEYN